MNRARVLISAAAAFGVAGLSQAAWADHHEAPDAEAILDHLWAIEQRQNDNANGAPVEEDVQPSQVAPDAVVVFSEGPPNSGMSPQMVATLQDPNFSIQTTPLRGWVSASGDLAVTVADTEINFANEDGTTSTQLGTRQFVWVRGEDGTWTIVSIFNAGSRTPE